MHFFDNEYLRQYIDQGVALKVYDGYDWLDVADISDLTDPIKGNGYDPYGKDHYFLYKDLEQIKVGNRIFTLDQLQAQQSGEPETDEEKPEPKAEKDTDIGPSAEPDEEEKPEKGPELSSYSPIFNIGRDLIAEYRKMKKW